MANEQAVQQVMAEWRCSEHVAKTIVKAMMELRFHGYQLQLSEDHTVLASKSTTVAVNPDMPLDPTAYTHTGKHYSVYCNCGERWDVYRIMQEYGIENPALFHAAKKLLRAGKGTKPLRQDVEEAISTLRRLLELMDKC